MRVAVVAYSGIYPIHIGGPGNVGYFLAKEFGRLGHPTTLFVRGRNREEISILETAEESRLENVKVVPIQLDYGSGSLLNPFLLFRKLVESCMELSSADFDAVLYNSPPIDIAVLFPLVCKIRGSKQAIILHGLLHSHGLLYHNFLGRFIIRFHKRWFDSVVTPGGFTKRRSLPCGFNNDEIAVIPNGIPLEEIEKASPIDLEGSPRIIHAGVLSRRKGIETLLRSIPQIAETYPETRLYLVGDGPERASLEHLSDTLGIRDRTEFVGFLSDTKEVFDYYKSCDVFVMTSHKEAFGITLLEAMACNIPVIATNIEGAPRMLVRNGNNGFLFPVGDHEALSGAVLKVLGSKTLRELFVKRNNQLVRSEFSWESIASRYIEMFKNLTLG